jgi:hypothetical protein
LTDARPKLTKRLHQYEQQFVMCIAEIDTRDVADGFLLSRDAVAMSPVPS